MEGTRKQYYNLKNHKENTKNTRTIYPNPKPVKGLSFILFKAVFIQSKNTVKSEIFWNNITIENNCFVFEYNVKLSFISVIKAVF